MGFDIIYTFGSDNETSSLICMIEMWAILHHTFILFYGNFFFKARHWRNCSLEWTQETPSSGIYFSLGQSKIDNSWREVRSWRPFLSRDLRFWNSFIGRVLRLVEVLPGKHFSSLQSWQDNNNWLGDYSLCKPHCFLLAMSFSEVSMARQFILVGRPSGKDSTCWQFVISKIWRDGRNNVSMFSRSDLRWRQSELLTV